MRLWWQGYVIVGTCFGWFVAAETGTPTWRWTLAGSVMGYWASRALLRRVYSTHK